jgi:hypothetical protein
MSASRLAVIAAALCCGLLVFLVLRYGTIKDPPVASYAPSRAAVSPPSSIKEGGRRSEGEGPGSSRSAGRRNQAGQSQLPPARSQPDHEAATVTDGSARMIAPGLAREDQAAARRRNEVVEHLPAPRDRNREPAPSIEEALLNQGYPAGTRFAARLDGTATAADGNDPIVEKNTDHDGNDGIYFPSNAQLAYPARAGVQGDAGTVALWVEPVDWDGNDASVHSFFRLNDAGDGSYRFHLLKDSRDLRFQFITDEGENNVRVPIDWWPRGEGHHVAATWDDNVLRVYVDGAVVGEQAYTGTLKVGANVPGWWGSMAEAGTPGAGAVLKETLVSGRPLAESEIEALSKDD